jgi:hypothetical protein
MGFTGTRPFEPKYMVVGLAVVQGSSDNLGEYYHTFIVTGLGQELA